MKRTVFPTFLFLIALVSFIPGCNSKELSRSSAQNLIEASGDFKQPFALPLMQGFIANGGQGKLRVLDDAVETPQQAGERKAKQYLEIYPQVAVANYLGLVTAQVKALEAEQPRQQSWMDSPMWSLDEKYYASEKAKALWKDYNLPPSENSIPLAGKEFVEVTGISKQGEEAATAEFTWKFVSNETSRYFDSSTAEFKSLPGEIQQSMLGRQPPSVLDNTPEDQTIKFAAAARQGQAVFRRYDDGWRLEAVMFQ